ncbi:MAG TPA: RNA polymerase subunit sigma-70 [Planctomycetaceae bacterium]|nr:RNA polymerase subunit sigma-70 [Planctomycetaceae bacterium]
MQVEQLDAAVGSCGSNGSIEVIRVVKEVSKSAKRAISEAKKRPSTRLPAWLKSPELVGATNHWEANRVDLGDGSAETLSKITKRLSKTEIGLITHPDFDSNSAGKDVFAAPLGLAPANNELGLAAIKRAGVDLPAHLGRLCEAKLLTPEQESMLFQRMNFLRHQALKVRAQLNPQKPTLKSIELLDRLILMADWHRDRIVEANMRLVFSIVKKFVNSNNHFDDLLSDGIVALMRAVEKFDFGRGFRFSTYATQVVRRNAYRQVVQVQQERVKIVGGVDDLGLDVSDECRQSAISEKRWHELRARLAVMLGDLDRREKFIIRARFSLGSHRRVHTLQALANRLGVSKERVRQLERRAMEKLRAMAGDFSFAELES